MVEAIVEFDYKAQHDDELTITVGDIITNIRKEDGGWWEGQLKGRRGLFPDNFVREIKKDVKKESFASKAPELSMHEVSNGSSLLLSETIIRTSKKGERNRRRRCQVAFSYMPQNEDELELKVGDIIEVVGEVEEGWWEGVLNGKTGMFPSNFIKEFSDSDDTRIVHEEHLIKPRKSAFEGSILYKVGPTKIESCRRYNSLRDTTGSESDGGDSSSTKSEGANGAATIQPKKIKGIGFGDIFKDNPIKLRPRSIEVDNDFLPVEKTVGKRMPTATTVQEARKIELDSRTKMKEYCKVIFPYEAQNEDELTIKEGDIVTLVNKDCIDAGWWEGELNGKRGVFPDNFVKLLLPDFEKERPKKPPPPSAPFKQGSATTDRKHEIKKVPPERPECLPHRTEEKDLEGFDSIVSVAEKLSHPTTTRPKATGRRPPSQSFTSSSLSSPDFFDSPSPEDEKEEQVSLSHKVEPLKKAKTVTISLVSDNKVSLPTKPGSLTSGSALSSSLSSSSILHPTSVGTPGHRSNSPSLFSTEGKLKTDHSSQSETALEELSLQVKELRTIIETMKDQQKKEIKQLLSELDEEKKIRLQLQMEINDIKKALQSK
ncbi:SH3 domain-containing kinase-binding protein 1 isoform X5 [Pantherophis guttatus]|uniref:SH3 domain-containing kinase-binding protein 1 n=1 Tax=Pantherophis guttatus TaxID=94885 RepID=A0A6P9DCV5_PANGU|nr:SH3 domain-containing kinase-binding protein 1 isoform X5 [Pantherophis guttatus]